jgi:hypothetical protein
MKSSVVAAIFSRPSWVATFWMKAWLREVTGMAVMIGFSLLIDLLRRREPIRVRRPRFRDGPRCSPGAC